MAIKQNKPDVELLMWQSERKQFALLITEDGTATGTPVDLNLVTPRFVAYDVNGNGQFKCEIGDGALVSVALNTITITVSTTKSATLGRFRWVLYDINAGGDMPDAVLANGILEIRRAVKDVP